MSRNYSRGKFSLKSWKCCFLYFWLCMHPSVLLFMVKFDVKYVYIISTTKINASNIEIKTLKSTFKVLNRNFASRIRFQITYQIPMTIKLERVFLICFFFFLMEKEKPNLDWIEKRSQLIMHSSIYDWFFTLFWFHAVCGGSYKVFAFHNYSSFAKVEAENKCNCKFKQQVVRVLRVGCCGCYNNKLVWHWICWKSRNPSKTRLYRVELIFYTSVRVLNIK